MLYKAREWSKNGNQIVKIHFYLIKASELTVKNMRDDARKDPEVKTTQDFLHYLRMNDVKVEEVEPISLDEL